MEQAKKFLEKIERRDATLAIIGMGYVGLPLAVDTALAGFDTIGVDVSEGLVRALAGGVNHILDVEDGELRQVLQAGTFHPTTDYGAVASADAILICVPTPLDEHQQPDMQFIVSAAESIRPYLKKGVLVVLESTTYPGTTEGLLRDILEKDGKRAGEDFYLAFSPERVDPGNDKYKTRNTPKVVGGMGEAANAMSEALYKAVLQGEVHVVSSPAVAEMEKILENTFRNINIGLANEMALICNRMGIDVWEVIDAAKTKPYGFMPFYPGPGVGGHCIPLDPYYLGWKAKEYNYTMRMIETSGQINTAMPEYILQRLQHNLSERGIALHGAKVLVLGIAYKANIGDCRESPALYILRLLEDAGAEISYHDPHIAKLDPLVAHSHFRRAYESTALTESAVAEADIVLILTAHRAVDYSFVAQHARAVFDTRNATSGIKADNVEKL